MPRRARPRPPSGRIGRAWARGLDDVARAGAPHLVDRWGHLVVPIQRDIIVIPKSVRRNRMEQNLDVFGFTLTDEEMSRIAAMDTGASLFFDHRDPAMVSRLNSRRET